MRPMTLLIGVNTQVNVARGTEPRLLTLIVSIEAEASDDETRIACSIAIDFNKHRTWPSLIIGTVVG